MQLYIEHKTPRQALMHVSPVSVELPSAPANVGQLIGMLVEIMVDAYNAKQRQSVEHSETDVPLTPIDESEIDSLAQTGKIAFGLSYNGKRADKGRSKDTALEAYADGLFKMFLNGQLLGEARDSIDLKNGDILTIVRLTFLSGRMC